MDANIPLNDRAKAIIIILYFLTASRNCELLSMESSSTKLGLRHENFKKRMPKLKLRTMLLEIVSFKNQKVRSIPKRILIGNPACGSPANCPCYIVNSVTHLLLYLEQKKLISSQRTYNLALKEKHVRNHVFVWENGYPITTKDLCKIVREMIEVNKLSQPKRYTPYSLRIGGTTFHISKYMSKTEVMNFVGWAVTKGNRSARYTRYSDEQKSSFIKRSLHNRASSNEWTIYDPWREARA